MQLNNCKLHTQGLGRKSNMFTVILVYIELYFASCTAQDTVQNAINGSGRNVQTVQISK